MNDNERTSTASDDSPQPAAGRRPDKNESGTGPDRAAPATREVGGRKGLDPVRYGDWEKDGRCIDF